MTEAIRSKQYADSVALEDEEAVVRVLYESVLGLWGVVNNLSRLRPVRWKGFRVTIFGSARAEPGTFAYEEVKLLARDLAAMGCEIVTGGGPGLMQAANEGAMAAGRGEQSIGIRIQLDFEQKTNPFVGQAYEHGTFFSRLHHFVLLSHAFIVVPGGIGTTLEALMIWQLLQVRRLYGTPLIMIGRMWPDLVQWAKDHMLGVEPHLADPIDFAIPRCVADRDAALAIIREYHGQWVREGTSTQERAVGTVEPAPAMTTILESKLMPIPQDSLPSVTHGTSSPLGATPGPDGTNFTVFSKPTTAIELLLFDRVDDARAARAIRLEPALNRTYHYWHVFVPGVRAGQLYAYRAEGPWDPANGLRFDPTKVLLDPYGRGVAVPEGYDRGAAAAPGDNSATAMKSVVVDQYAYNWEGDAPLRRPSVQTIVYEMHVRGFTRHPSSGVGERTRGTYAGLIEKIPYLQELGITAVELLPVFQFDAEDCPPGRVNYWGYAPVSFFAPHQAYSSRRDLLGPVDEFRDMVKALHRAGIEVILDVVFNHTAEGDERGPTLCFRGLDNNAYYILENDRARYANYSGTGNTLNANHPIVRRMIVDSLRYWVEAMHVDGFRFDLASILARDAAGQPLPNPPVLWDIESEPALAGVKLIAEAWDAGGLYQVGSFIGDSWKEWNGRFRDDVRDFFRGEPGSVARVADRLVGSPQIYGHEAREAEQSVNFVTCHDGFTLNDLVSYDRKHNEANGENNRDGANDNRSWNCGVEGQTDDPEIEGLRNRQVKNFLTVTLLALGMPMILMGDEARRSQSGNNNAYCQDNEISWFDWTLLDRHADVHRFVRLLNARRLLRDVEHERRRVTLNQLIAQASTAWHGVRLGQPDWADHSHSVAFTAELIQDGILVYLILNAYWEPLEFELPPVGDGGASPWRRWIDTALESPQDIVPWQTAPSLSGNSYRAASRSVVVLFAEIGTEKALN